MRVGVVISTIGRSGVLELVLESLSTQTHAPQQIIVVDQGSGPDVERLVAVWEKRLPVSRLTSTRGVSLGRNTGWKALDLCDVVAFPDDDSTLGPNVLAAVVAEFEDDSNVMALSGRRAGSVQRIAFEGGRCDMDRADVWTKAIEFTTFYRIDALLSTGGFNEDLGVGGPTKWQSGEGSDLLLRVMAGGGRVIYEPSILITEHQNFIARDAYLAKVRKYGRGTGRVYKLRYGLFDQALVVAKPLTAAAVYALTGRKLEAENKLMAALGRAEGMVGKPAERLYTGRA